MDTLVLNGDFDVDVCGVPREIRSIDEACQRVRFSLAIKKGSYIYNRNLGADFSSLNNYEDINKTARLLCMEALVGQDEISLGKVLAEKNEDGDYKLTVEVIFNNESRMTEVTVNADV